MVKRIIKPLNGKLNSTDWIRRSRVFGGAVLGERQDAVAHLEEYLYTYFFFRQKSPWKKLANDVAQQRIRSLTASTAEAGTAVITTIAVYKGISEQINDVESVVNRPEVRMVPHSVQVSWCWLPPDTYVRRFQAICAIGGAPLTGGWEESFGSPNDWVSPPIVSRNSIDNSR